MAARKKATVKATGVPVTLRRLARDFGDAKKGTIALILNPKVFGDAGTKVNWLGGVTYPDRAAAIAAAGKAGAKVLNPPAAA